MRSNQMALDYSQSPFQPPAQFVKALARSLASLNSYPDPSYRLLKERLAKKHGVLPSNISLGNGADELIDLITAAFGNQILIPTPTFGQYELAAKRHNRAYRRINCLLEEKFSLANIKEPSNAASLIWLCNPNNPLGMVIQKKEILDFAANSKALIVVDEAYADFANESVASFTKKQSNLIVLRTFSKGFGLAGLRIGYMIADAGIIAKIEAARQPFNLNSMAAAAVPIALRYENMFAKMREMIENNRDAFIVRLKKIGYRVLPSSTNFVTIKLSNPMEAKNLFSFLEKAGIRVLSPWNEEFSGMPRNMLRISIGTKRQMDSVFKALAKFKKI